MTTIYSTGNSSDDGGTQYFSNKADAIKDARETANRSGYDVEVTKCVVAPMGKQETILRCLSGSGWASELTVVAVVKPKGRK